MTISHAIATAINQVKKWAAGGEDVTPATRAKAARALAQWEKMKASTKELGETETVFIDVETKAAALVEDVEAAVGVALAVEHKARLEAAFAEVQAALAAAGLAGGYGAETLFEQKGPGHSVDVGPLTAADLMALDGLRLHAT